MNNIMGQFCVALVLIILTGCATTASGPTFQEAKATINKPGYSIVYVYRAYAEPTAWGSTIHIDGKELKTLNQGGFTWAYVKPGQRNISGIWSSMASQRDAKISVTLKEKETYYVELTGISKADLVGSSNSGRTVTTYIDLDINSGLRLIDPKIGELEIDKCCKYQGSESLYY